MVSRRLATDPRWRSLATYALVAGITAAALFLVNGDFVIPDDAPLHAWAGLIQRVVVLVVLFPCTIVLALSVIRVTKEADAPRWSTTTMRGQP